MENRTDQELMQAAVARNTAAFQMLYQRYELPIFNFLLRYTGNRETAEDLLQETFTRVWFAAHTFRLNNGNFKGWLYKIALNTARDEMTKKRYAYQYLDVWQIPNSPCEPAIPETEQPDADVSHTTLQDSIFQALEQLPPVYRETIILKHYQQLKFREIAQITNTPEGTIKARFHRALALLKDILEPIAAEIR
ncbi:sigma-70 family RNA polymerase sigma factor [candidate division KSB1 bacterium]|nr:sigma-70 family RNA polymerase sigma factor [candidate division KSB1 bacterium]